MPARESASVLQLFRFTDRLDKGLVLLGTLGCIGTGMTSPITMLVLGSIFNAYGNVDAAFSYRVVDEYALKLLYVAFGVGSAAFIGVCWTRTAERQASRMRTKYLESVLKQDVGFFDTHASSTTYKVVSTVSSDAHTIQDVISEKLPNFLSNTSTFFFSIFVAFEMSWRLSLAALPFSLLFIVPGVVYGRHLMELMMKMKEAYVDAGGLAEQSISSIRTVASYVGEHGTLERFSRALEQSTKLGIKQGFMKGMVIGSIGMIFAVWAFQTWIGSILVIKTGAQGGPVFVSGVCVIFGGMAVMSALPNVRYLSEAMAAASRILEMIDTLPTIDSEDGKGVVLENIRGDIEFKDIKFAYPSRPDTLVLHNFNLTVTAGMTIGLVGSSGSGKSTVISLLERFYDPLEGDILLDGHSIKSLQLKWLRSQMGLVSQEPVLFATSIKENILFGNEGASMELVVSAAKAANAHDFITKFPEGYETQVGQSGVQMSGGQKQRIAIARALIKEPQILLLDEATSALDAQSEREVQDALDQASVGRTTIIIAHRLSTISKANSIVVLQAGEVLESGFHDQLILMGEGGAYFAMFQLQQSALIDEASNSPCSPTEERNKKTREMNFNKRSPGKSFIADHSYSDSKEENNKLPSYSHQLRLLQMNAPEWNRALIGCFGAITFGAVQPISTYCMGTVIWVFSLKDNDLIRSQTRIYCLLFASLAVISVVTNLLQHYNFAIMGERLVKRVREKILEKVLTFEIGWFDQDENSSAAICARLATEANMVRSLVGDRISLLVQVTATALLSFVLAAVITWRLSIVMIAMQPLIIACFYSKKVLMTKLSGKAVKAQNEGSQLASEAVVNHRTITAFSLQKRILGLFKDSLRGPRHDTLKLSWLAGFGLSVSQFLTTTSIALAFWYGGRLLIQRLVTPKHLFQAFFILMGMGKFIADAGSATTDLAKGGNAVKSIFRILDRRSEIHPDDPKGIKVTTIKGHVELKGVYFSYPSRPEQIIFNGLSLNIEAGKTVALVGQSGSGKSTIIGLIERFYDPLKGSIEIDEQDVKNYNLRSLRSKIALVSQEPTLFSGTIRENILYGNVNATETELMEAAAIANAHEFISGMKDGYETQCGVRGVQLSGGQKQRIALARAILTNPKILLLDEATNALDSISENLVQEALEKMMVDRTCVVIAHRLSTIRKSDSIAVIENGRITEQGAHSDLLALGHCGSYYSLVKLQQDSSSA